MPRDTVSHSVTVSIYVYMPTLFALDLVISKCSINTPGLVAKRSICTSNQWLKNKTKKHLGLKDIQSTLSTTHHGLPWMMYRETQFGRKRISSEDIKETVIF